MTKVNRLLAEIENKADGILISSDVNRLYFTDFEYSDGYLLITPKKSYLITDFRYIEAAEKQVSGYFKKIMFKGFSDVQFLQMLKENNISRLMFEDTRMTCAEYEKFKKQLDGITLVPSGDIIENLRLTKDETEAQKVIKAQDIAEKSLANLIDRFDKNMTEQELATYLEYLMKRNGADGISFSTIAVSGKASSLPHGVPRNQRLENGFLTIDFGAVYKGYHSDMTRTFCIGKATDEMKTVYNTVLEAQTAAINTIMNGERNCFEIDRIAREYIYSKGYKGCFGHGLGHGVGLEIHEAPRLSPSVNKELCLTEGNIVTVEPGIYIEDKFGVRIEDMIYMSPNGPINITKMPKNLIEL